MFLGFISLKTFLLIIHIFGVALGAGGAFIGDGIFFRSVHDGKISKQEFGFIQLSSKFTWVGLFILFVSGIAIFLTDLSTYLDSSKFLAKMTIVLILTINGVFFHVMHIPRLEQDVGKLLSSTKSFNELKAHLIFSGVVSMVSWSFALVLGMLRSIPYSYWTIMLVYLLVVSFAWLFGRIVTRHLF